MPGVYYTADGQNIPVQMPELPLVKMYEQVGRTNVFQIEVEDENGAKTLHPVFVWDAQYSPVKSTFTHVDFLGVDLDKEIKVKVQVEYAGTPKGVKVGGKMETYRDEVVLAAKPTDMPRKLVLDVTGMEKAVYRVLRENPDAHVILNLIVYPSAYWLKNNRNELHPGKDGNPLILRNGAFTNRTSAEFPVKPGETWSPSIHSAKYRADIARVLEDVMRNFEKTDASKAVAGIYITGGDDGQFRAPVVPDSSPVAQNAFRQSPIPFFFYFFKKGKDRYCNLLKRCINKFDILWKIYFCNCFKGGFCLFINIIFHYLFVFFVKWRFLRLNHFLGCGLIII